MENHAIFKSWIDILRPLFPESAEIKIQKDDDNYLFIVNWLLKTDRDRPNKRSKTIKIVLQKEYVEDYFQGEQSIGINFEKNLRQFVKQKLSGFSPDHDSFVSPPAVKWDIPIDVFK